MKKLALNQLLYRLPTDWVLPSAPKKIAWKPSHKIKTAQDEIEFSWVGDFNPRMRKMWLEIGGEPQKHYITYRYLFDRSKKFERYPVMKE